ncbi:CSP-like protein, partial [Mya arenaria]
MKPCCKKATCDITKIPTPAPPSHATLLPGSNPPYTGTNPLYTLQPGTNAPYTGTNPQYTFQPGTNPPYTGTNPLYTLQPGTNAPYTGTNPQCPTFSDIPNTCYLVQDPKDACCKVPQCGGSLTPVTVTGTTGTGPAGSNVVPIGSHQMCPSYPTSIPSYCQMNTVPGMCCKTLSCNIPQTGSYVPNPMLVPTPAPSLAPGQTPAPFTGSQSSIYPSGTQPVIGGTSPYPGAGYALPPGVTAGSIRNGCDYTCECKDAMTGYYECKPQCPRYTLPQDCYTVKASGQCCDQPVCTKPDGTEFNPLTNPNSQYPVYGAYGQGTGGFRPGYNPSTGTSSATSVCPTYTNLPTTCYMITLPGQCCQEPRCNTPVATTINTPHIHNTPAPHLSGCVDQISNCASYGKTSCVDPFLQWAKQNCVAYCGLCPATGTTSTPGCTDKLSNCDAFGASSCTGIYEPWARDNCRKTCNLCTTSVPVFTTHAPMPSNNCVDKLTTCDQYDPNTACVDPYKQWAIDNCQKTCNLCTGTANIGTTISGSPDRNWMIMMKGVAGVPGDLYSLWNSGQTANPNVPEAMYLTATYPGHYKPDLSNYWDSLCIDKVKVAIFNGGIERANIIFDATGANKMNWFDQSRIISSTWTDIKYAPSNLFSMLGNPSMGHEFMAASSGQGCNVQGWVMISTQNNCPYETGHNNAFYYAPGQQSANFGQSAGPTQPTNTIVATSQFCIYKNNIYKQGDTWTDGCQYNCTCEDATTGFYRCVDLCPVWNNLPSQCTLQKAAGDCCSKPVCQGGVIIDQSNLTNTCLYNGQYYHEGNTWRDGCKYNCECKNGQTGYYECNTLCLQWNLPPQCHMDPAPAGKCCQVPVCPSNIQITYPQNYVQHGSKPTTDSSGSQPTTDSSGLQLTTDSSGSKPTTDASGSQPTTDASGLQLTTDSSGSQPTTDASGSQPTTDSSGSQPTTDASDSQPTTDFSGLQPTTDSSGLQLTTDYSGLQPTTHSSWLQLTTDSSGSQPTTDSSWLQLTTDSSGLQPTTDSSGSQLTTDSSGFQLTTDSSGSQSTTDFSGLQLTTDSTHYRGQWLTIDSSGLQLTTEFSGSEPITESSGSEPTTDSSGSEPTTDSSGSEPTTESSGSEPTTDYSGSEPTTDSSGLQPTIDSSGSESTSDSSGSEPTTESSGSEPTTDSSGSEPTTDSICYVNLWGAFLQSRPGGMKDANSAGEAMMNASRCLALCGFNGRYEEVFSWEGHMEVLDEFLVQNLQPGSVKASYNYIKRFLQWVRMTERLPLEAYNKAVCLISNLVASVRRDNIKRRVEVRRRDHENLPEKDVQDVAAAYSHMLKAVSFADSRYRTVTVDHHKTSAVFVASIHMPEELYKVLRTYALYTGLHHWGSDKSSNLYVFPKESAPDKSNPVPDSYINKWVQKAWRESGLAEQYPSHQGNMTSHGKLLTTSSRRQDITKKAD